MRAGAALLGRLFWSANSGDGANKFFRNKLDTSLQRTLARKGKPPFLDYIKVQTLTAGDHMPVFSIGGPVDFRPDGSLVRDAQPSPRPVRPFLGLRVHASSRQLCTHVRPAGGRCGRQV